MGSSQHARTLSRRCVESDPKVCRERPKGKEKSASLQGYVEVETFGRGSDAASCLRLPPPHGVEPSFQRSALGREKEHSVECCSRPRGVDLLRG